MLWSLFLIALAVDLSAADVPAAEREALVDIYNHCGGYRWVHQANWLKGDPCSNAWYGVQCDPTNSTIVFLDPTSRTALNPLYCKIPESIGNLTNLEWLYLSNDVFRSHLHGELPSTMQNLKKLRCLYLSHGNLNGTLPAWLNELPVLQGLFLRHNSFSGQMPDLSGLKYLEDIWADTQYPGGGIVSNNMSWVNKWQYLTHIHIEANDFSGPLPEKLCSKSVHCHAFDNHWDCPLPTPGCCGVAKCPAHEAGRRRSSMKISQSELRQRGDTYSSGSPLPYVCYIHQ